MPSERPRTRRPMERSGVAAPSASSAAALCRSSRMASETMRPDSSGVGPFLFAVAFEATGRYDAAVTAGSAVQVAVATALLAVALVRL